MIDAMQMVIDWQLRSKSGEILDRLKIWSKQDRDRNGKPRIRILREGEQWMRVPPDHQGVNPNSIEDNMADAIDRKYHREAGLEAEVLDLLAEGYTEREVAGQMGISSKTIWDFKQPTN